MRDTVGTIEHTLWAAEYERCPWGPDRDNWNVAMSACAIISASGVTPPELDVLMFGKKEERVQSADEMLSIARAYKRITEGNDGS